MELSIARQVGAVTRIPPGPFDPAAAAGNAALFSGILAAIVLAVLGQLAVTGRMDTRRPRPFEQSPAAYKHHVYQYSLLLGVPLLVTLLANSYMFVLLSGHKNLPKPLPSDPISTLRSAGCQFAICGSVLAVAAAGTLVFIRLVLIESGSNASATVSASRTVILIGILTDAVFLVYGYGDIHAAFYYEYFHVGRWMANALVVLLVPVIVLVSPWPRRLVINRTHPVQLHKGKRAWQFQAVVGLTVAASTLVPTVAFLYAGKYPFDGSPMYHGHIDLVSFACGGWTSLLLAFLIWLVKASTEKLPAAAHPKVVRWFEQLRRRPSLRSEK